MHRIVTKAHQSDWWLFRPLVLNLGSMGAPKITEDACASYEVVSLLELDLHMFNTVMAGRLLIG